MLADVTLTTSHVITLVLALAGGGPTLIALGVFAGRLSQRLGQAEAAVELNKLYIRQSGETLSGLKVSIAEMAAEQRAMQRKLDKLCNGYAPVGDPK